MMMLTEAAQAIQGQLSGNDMLFSEVTTDSRRLQPGSLFVALEGERFDGHDYVGQCFEQGATAAVVSSTYQPNAHVAGKNLIFVEDTRLALGTLAAYWRQKFSIPLAGITGSNGKTTVKEMLAAILRHVAGTNNVLATQGNLNNDIGLPLTLLQLRAHHQFAVIEMGMNHSGEISQLTRIAQPTVAVINNAGAAHLEGLGSVEAVAHAKGEIFEGLSAKDIAVINNDDANSNLWKTLVAGHPLLTFGLNSAADITARYEMQANGSQVHLITPQGEVSIWLPVPGIHNIRNALAASSAAIAMGISLQAIAEGLNSYAGVKGRLQRKTGYNGALLIDDTYNANPASMKAAIQVLATQPGYKIFVMGDMGELGETATALHTEIGLAAKKAGIDVLFTLGQLSVAASHEFGGSASHFDTPESLTATLKEKLNPEVSVLIKGSRFMRMERIVDALIQDTEALCS